MADPALLIAAGLLALSKGASAGARVLDRDNARGVRWELQGLLDAWEREGTHAVRIPSKPWGGLRTSEADQASYASSGQSNATTLRDTPHGRGAAVDVWPEGFGAYVSGPWLAVPAAMRAQFETFGRFAESRGFTWGGRWRSNAMPNGDQPHVEIKNWRGLPFPPEQT